MPRESIIDGLLLRCAIGTDLEHRRLESRATHRALPRASVFAEIATELKAIVGVPPTGAYMEEGAGRPRELVRLLDSPDQVTALKSHPRLVLHEPDVEYEAELRFVQTHGTGPFEFGARVDEWGASRGLGR